MIATTQQGSLNGYHRRYLDSVDDFGTLSLAFNPTHRHRSGMKLPLWPFKLPALVAKNGLKSAISLPDKKDLVPAQTVKPRSKFRLQASLSWSMLRKPTGPKEPPARRSSSQLPEKKFAFHLYSQEESAYRSCLWLVLQLRSDCPAAHSLPLCCYSVL